MEMGERIKKWRIKRRLSTQTADELLGLGPGHLESIENGSVDPPATTLQSIAGILKIPVPWLFADPDHLDDLLQAFGEDDQSILHAPDPVTEFILKAGQRQRELFFMLGSLIEQGDPKLLRAAEANLRSLFKETRRSLIPWENRNPGNFDPPSD